MAAARGVDQNMHRLFVALRPPPHVRSALIDAMGGVPGARWQDDDQLHITLRFIGEVDRHQAEDIATALGSVTTLPFELVLDGVGQFDRRGIIDTLWVGVRPHDQIAALHRKVDQAVQRVGLQPEGRAYIPHITVARFGRSSGAIDGFVANAATVMGLRFTVAHFMLFESSIGSDGARYEAIARYALR